MLLCVTNLVQAVYQSLLHLGWIDKLLDNISTIFIDLYKDQLRSSRSRVIEYPFDKYFEQQVRELEDNTGAVSNDLLDDTEIKKDPLVSSDNGGPPPPPVPGLRPGMCVVSYGELLLTTSSAASGCAGRGDLG